MARCVLNISLLLLVLIPRQTSIAVERCSNDLRTLERPQHLPAINKSGRLSRFFQPLSSPSPSHGRVDGNAHSHYGILPEMGVGLTSQNERYRRSYQHAHGLSSSIVQIQCGICGRYTEGRAWILGSGDLREGDDGREKFGSGKDLWRRWTGTYDVRGEEILEVRACLISVC